MFSKYTGTILLFYLVTLHAIFEVIHLFNFFLENGIKAFKKATTAHDSNITTNCTLLSTWNLF